ncbi:uncharacterized protein LOC134830911 [Culicoides brevitarsis]|uniref:uncharacterized protein LOC134830911 n=1 Tax=Culicoides brevitarsis TaxID=469753 RepID=UPI00307B7775
MGVRGLKSLMESAVPDGARNVNIEEEIQNYKRSNGGKSPILAIDLAALAYLLSSVDNATVGMRANIVLEKATEFFSRLKNFGASLTFFDTGTILPTKETNYFIQRKEAKAAKLEILRDLESKMPLQDLLKKHDNEFRGSSTIVPLLKEVARNFGNIYAPFFVEKHTIMAGFATKKNAFAVLGNDTNFLIYGKKWKFWFMDSIDFKKFVIREYNSLALMGYLNLTKEQMPLFATLAGNGIILNEDFEAFHGKRGVKKRVEKVSEFVRSQRFPLGSRDIDRIVKYVFRNKANSQIRTKIQESLDSYDFMKSIAPETEKDPFLKRLMSQEWAKHYDILKKIPQICLSSYVDIREQDFEKPFSELIITLLRRHMGILWQHKREPNMTLDVFVSAFQNRPAGCIQVEAEYPKIQVPPLENLIFRAETDGLDSIRQDLLKFVIGIGLDVTELFTFDKKFIPTIALLYYFVKEAGLKIEEADIFLLSIYETVNEKYKAHELTFPETLDLRAFKIVFLFIKIQRVLLPIFATLGYREMAKHASFDGLHFHLLWQEWRKLSSNEREERLSCIQKLRLYDN